MQNIYIMCNNGVGIFLWAYSMATLDYTPTAPTIYISLSPNRIGTLQNEKDFIFYSVYANYSRYIRKFL